MFATLAQLQDKYPQLSLVWNFTATSHAKGPDDALRGNAKWIDQMYILTRQNVVVNAETFELCLIHSDAYIETLLITHDDETIEATCNELMCDCLWQKVPLYLIPTTFWHTKGLHFHILIVKHVAVQSWAFVMINISNNYVRTSFITFILVNRSKTQYMN